MRKLKISLIISCVFLIASTTAFLLEAQESRDWTGVSGHVVLKSGTLDVDRTFQDAQEGVPTRVYVCDASGLKFLQYEKISSDDRKYVRKELGLPEVVEENVDVKDIKVVPISEGLKLVEKEKYAFLVAASHYESGISSLNYTGNDVEDLKARLIEIGFRAENIVVLRSGVDFNDVPTKKHIEERYRLLLSRVQEGDLVLVYLSGHGLQPEGSEVSYFAPVEVDLKDIPNTSVSINEMMKFLAESRAAYANVF